MRVSKYWIPVLTVGLIVLTVVIANITGDWLTSGKQILEQKSKAGDLTGDDVRGWMTLQNVSDQFKMPLDYLYTSLGLNLEQLSPETELRELENTVAFETEDVREVVRRFIAGEPAQLISETVPDVVLSEPTLAEPVEEEHSGPSELTAASTYVDIKGRMTLKEIADSFKLPLAELIEKSGLPADVDVKAPLRDLKSVAPDWEVSQVRDAVQEMLGQ